MWVARLQLWLQQVNSLTVKSAAHDVDIGKKLGSEGSGGHFPQKRGVPGCTGKNMKIYENGMVFPVHVYQFKINDSFVFFPVFFFPIMFYI